MTDYSHFTFEELVQETNNLQTHYDDLKESELAIKQELATIQLSLYETERDFRHARSTLLARNTIDEGEDSIAENPLSKPILVH